MLMDDGVFTSDSKNAGVHVESTADQGLAGAYIVAIPCNELEKLEAAAVSGNRAPNRIAGRKIEESGTCSKAEKR